MKMTIDNPPAESASPPAAVPTAESSTPSSAPLTAASASAEPSALRSEFTREYPPDDELMQPYRALSRSAVASFALAILSSLMVYFSPMTLFLPALGTAFGLVSVRAIRRYPLELSGRGLAWTGLVGSFVLLVSASALHTTIYLTEVPDGYERISFEQLQPDEANPQMVVPETALKLDGKPIFVKGYIHPSVSGLGVVNRFVLVPDLGTCCFGGQPKLTDMIEVTLPEKLGVQYSRRKQKLAGTLKVDTQLKRVDGLTGVFYQLEADIIR